MASRWPARATSPRRAREDDDEVAVRPVIFGRCRSRCSSPSARRSEVARLLSRQRHALNVPASRGSEVTLCRDADQHPVPEAARRRGVRIEHCDGVAFGAVRSSAPAELRRDVPFPPAPALRWSDGNASPALTSLLMSVNGGTEREATRRGMAWDGRTRSSSDSPRCVPDRHRTARRRLVPAQGSA